MKSSREERLANIVLNCPVCGVGKSCPVHFLRGCSVAQRVAWLEDQDRASLDFVLKECDEIQQVQGACLLI